MSLLNPLSRFWRSMWEDHSVGKNSRVGAGSHPRSNHSRFVCLQPTLDEKHATLQMTLIYIANFLLKQRRHKNYLDGNTARFILAQNDRLLSIFNRNSQWLTHVLEDDLEGKLKDLNDKLTYVSSRSVSQRLSHRHSASSLVYQRDATNLIHSCIDSHFDAANCRA